jgi:hexosaminidase
MGPLADLLWPRPQVVEVTGSPVRLPREPRVVVAEPAPELEAARQRVCRALQAHGLHPRLENGPSVEPAILLERIPGSSRAPEGYRLQVAAPGIRISAGDPAGLFYGACTLAQWLSLHRSDGGEPSSPHQAAEGLPLVGIEVEDWPDLPVRGFMLDVSRDRVPTNESLLALVELLAGLKINQLQLYMEHTFAYQGHEAVWREASPLTAEEVAALDAFCRSRFVELVPNQNSFGHFHRWLIHDRYRPLAEVPEGFEHPFSDRPEPFSLCPTDPGSLELLAELYDQLLPCFASRQVNVGLDETMDLGQGRSAAEVARRGKARVYLDFLHAVHELARQRGHRIQLWADIVLETPELIAELPEDSVALIWGYEADHPFLEQAARFSGSGRELLLCPGTGSWNSFAGRSTNTLLNIGRAAMAAQETGARGCLICDWGDNGHLQPHPMSYLGLIAGAGFCWATETAAAPLEISVEALLDQHVFADSARVTGSVARQLGDTYLYTGAPCFNGSPLFHLLVFPDQGLDQKRYQGMTVASLAASRDHVETWAGRLDEARSEAPDGGLVLRELRWVAGLLLLACDLGSTRLAAGGKGSLEDLPAPTRRRLAAALEPLVEQHAELWLARSRAGGRLASRGRLQRACSLLAP